jgi:hypothetical protein
MIFISMQILFFFGVFVVLVFAFLAYFWPFLGQITPASASSPSLCINLSLW